MAASTFASRLNAPLAEAVDLFVMTKFEKCFEICSSVITSAKNEPEQERNFELIEAATALGIQALAEIDMWHYAIEFICDVYGAIDLCPSRIIQVCILLHAHVQEYLPCHKLVQSWLRNPDNLNNKQCAKVIRVYSQHILFPTDTFEVLKEILDGCSSLSTEEKNALLQFPQAKRSSACSDDIRDGTRRRRSKSTESEREELDEYEQPSFRTSNRLLNTEDPDIFFTKKVESNSKGNSNDKSNIVAVCRSVVSMIWNHLKTMWSKGFVLTCMGILALWGLAQAQTGDPVSSLGQLVILWRVFLQRLRQIFS